MIIQRKQKRFRIVLLCMGAIVLALGLFWFLHPHRYGDWTILAEADCLNPGLRERTCFCGKTESEEIPCTAHIEDSMPMVMPSCRLPGSTGATYCTVCGTITQPSTEIPKLYHDAVFVEAREPDCKVEGYTLGHRCKSCNTIISGCRIIPALEHSFSDGICSHCSVTYPLMTWPLPKPGEEIHGGAGKVVTPEEAQKAVFDTINPEDYKGYLPNHPNFWKYSFEYTVCMADITLMETVDCLAYMYSGEPWFPITIAHCRVNAVYNARPDCQLEAGDEVTIALRASMYVPYHAVQSLKKDGRYLVSLDDLSAPNLHEEFSPLSFQNHVQYMAVEDRWCQLEVVGEEGDNPRVDTANMGLIYGLDAIPDCENYLEWGTQDVARFFSETKAAEEKRLGYELEYYATLWEDR